MNRLATVLTLTGLALIAMTGWCQAWIQHHQHLQKPGVRIDFVPVLNEKDEIARTNSVFLPSRTKDWMGQAQPIQQIELGYLPQDTTYGRKRYVNIHDGSQVFMTVVLMGTDRSSIHQPEYCLTGSGWEIERRVMTSISLDGNGFKNLPVQRFDLTDVQQMDGTTTIVKGVYAYWFVADGKLTADHRERMWWMAKDLVSTGTLQRWAYVSCFARCGRGEQDKAFERIAALVRETVPEFQTTLPE